MAAASVVVTGCVTVSHAPPLVIPQPLRSAPARASGAPPGTPPAERAWPGGGPRTAGGAGSRSAPTGPAASRIAGSEVVPGGPADGADPAAPAGPPPRHADPRPGGQDRRPAAHPARPEPRRGIPPSVGRRPGSHPDVCRLGAEFGQWAPGSQASTICHQTYG